MVSSLTEKVGFYFFARRLVFGWRPVKSDDVSIARAGAMSLSFVGMLSLALVPKESFGCRAWKVSILLRETLNKSSVALSK